MGDDFRRPTLHAVIWVWNEHGLSDISFETVGLHEALVPWNDRRLSLLPSENTPLNPTELLGSMKMQSLLDCIKEAADIVI